MNPALEPDQSISQCKKLFQPGSCSTLFVAQMILEDMYVSLVHCRQGHQNYACLRGSPKRHSDVLPEPCFSKLTLPQQQQLLLFMINSSFSHFAASDQRESPFSFRSRIILQHITCSPSEKASSGKFKDNALHLLHSISV